MNRPNKKIPPTAESRSAKEGKEAKEDSRDPAEVRAASFRISAQRETVEAFVVAFILALLFRAFLAEAFVIPTGSMAPTLMGAHKDVICERCQTPYRCGASLERKTPVTSSVVVATICPNCRHTNALDLINDANDGTFNGDRILVSKFSYTLKEPERWDVIVFKYPGNPKQNYIKRLVGLPNEVLTVRHGDVYMRALGDPPSASKMLRKPPDQLLSMRHLVYDSQHQSPDLIKAGYPSRWQPWRNDAETPPSDSWQIDRDADGWSATVDASKDGSFHWLRYYHRWPDAEQWARADKGLSLASVDPYSSRLITDFYSYNAYINVSSSLVFQYDGEPATFRGSWVERILNGGYSKGEFRPEYRSGAGLGQFGNRADYGGYDVAADGMHWVGDLILESDVETSDGSRELLLELVESGVKYQCRVDLADGTATLGIDAGNDGADKGLFESDSGAGAAQRTAATSIRAGQRHQLRFSNCDDQLLLWVDDQVVEFDGPTTFDARRFRSVAEDYPRYTSSHPLDAAPAGVAVRGGAATLHQLRVDRDKYYIATKVSSVTGLNDYDKGQLAILEGAGKSNRQIQQMLGDRDLWTQFNGWASRRSVEFRLEEDQFFPMGDNSPESLDARCWAGTKRRIRLPGDVNKDAYTWTDASYVPRDLLVGKALVVFWPHSWNAPVPFTPNVKRMKLIR